MESTLEEIIKSPKLKIYSEEIIDILNDEQTKRKEFYKTMKEGDKVEFINGEIIFQSPAKLQHITASDLLFSLIFNYVNKKILGYTGHEKMMISLTRNDYEPDICFWNKDRANKFEKDQMKFPAPDFAVEVLSPSTENNDRKIKFEDYAAHGIKEYWIVDPENKIIEQYTLKGGNYELALKSDNGLIKSFAIKDFEIPIQSIFNEEENLKTLTKILSSS